MTINNMNAKKIILIITALIAIVAAFVFFVAPPQLSQTPASKIYKIGILVRGATYAQGVDGFKTKMKELGYEEGKNVTYIIRFVDKKEELPEVVSEFLKEDVDLIHTYSTPATTEAYKQTKTVPIVFGSMGDPLASKVIDSLQRPGTNVTGVGSLSAPLAAKRLEFLKEAMLSIHKVAIPFTPDDIPGKSSYNFALEAAKKLGIELAPYYISKERDVKATALAIKRKDVDGIVISSDSLVWANLAAYIEQAKKEKLPFAVFDKDMVEKGGLLGYGPDYFATGEQSAFFVDKIFKGAKPADLPIENPSKLLLVLNLKTAKDIGFIFPTSLLLKADKTY